MKVRGFDPEGTRLPIKLDTTANGEFSPVPRDGDNRRANRLAQQWASENARRRGLGRRAFMVSACGAAITLLAFNRANAAAGRTGGFFALDQIAAVDTDAALDRRARRELVFDVRGPDRHNDASGKSVSVREGPRRRRIHQKKTT